jgi:hypothetical protein
MKLGLVFSSSVVVSSSMQERASLPRSPPCKASTTRCLHQGVKDTRGRDVRAHVIFMEPISSSSNFARYIYIERHTHAYAF